MPLQTGAHIGPYLIEAAIGAGGMGEVYRATDTNLKRCVAIKVLPDALAGDPDRLARFQREAQVLASLNHQYIAQIYGLEEADGRHALVMELVEGPTLADRLAQGPLPVDEAIPIARQIAEALEAAHEQGIIHRDLKPANIKVRGDGTVKVLDFGLAKAFDPTGASGSASASVSPTITSPAMTEMGVILGTAAYMAPEQARGRAVDKRADIWAFGVVLYEMLAGEALFNEESVVDTLSAVMRKPIDLDQLSSATPARLRELVRRCLDRDPRRRLRDIGDARIALEDIGGGGPAGATAAGSSGHGFPAKGVAISTIVAVAVAAGAYLLGTSVASRRAAAAGAAADAGLGEFTHLTYQAGLESSPSLSPDGEFVIYTAIDGGDRDLFLLRVGGQKAINLTEDSPADEDHPAFSPDGRFIAFRSERGGGGLFVMGATGESVRRLTSFGDNPSWSPDGREIVFGTEGRSDPSTREKQSELWVVPASGGEPRRIFAGDAVQPAWSPSGARIAYWAIAHRTTGIRDVWTIAADGSDPRRVTDQASVDWDATWEPDGRHLDFVSDRSGATHPWRVAIDEKSGEPLGAPEPLHLPTSWSGQLSWAKDGRRLAYRTSQRTAQVTRLPFDTTAARVTGPAERLFDTTIAAVGLDLTADGWMLFRTMDTPEDVYVMRSDGTGLRKLTDDLAKDRWPVWSPDGQMAAFYSNRSGRYEIWTVRRDGSDLRQRTNLEGPVYFPTWSPDGRSMIITMDNELVRMPVSDQPVSASDVEEIPVDRGEAVSVDATSWSPDGRWVGGSLIGPNGALVGGLLLIDLTTGRSHLVRVDLPIPPGGSVYPTLSWLPDGRRAIVRWGEQILLVDAETERLTTLAQGFGRDGGIARLSADGRWIYMLDAREEGDVWLAGRAAPATVHGSH